MGPVARRKSAIAAWCCALLLLVPAVVRAGTAGDCGADADVTIDDLVIGVNNALGCAPANHRPSFDADGDRPVTVESLMRGVNKALGGCAISNTVAADALPTPTATPELNTATEICSGGEIDGIVTNSVNSNVLTAPLESTAVFGTLVEQGGKPTFLTVQGYTCPPQDFEINRFVTLSLGALRGLTPGAYPVSLLSWLRYTEVATEADRSRQRWWVSKSGTIVIDALGTDVARFHTLDLEMEPDVTLPGDGKFTLSLTGTVNGLGTRQK